MNNANVYYRYHSPFKPGEYVTIAYVNRIVDFHRYFFKEVLYKGISQIIKELNIPYDQEEGLSGKYTWVFDINEDDKSFKINWEFEGRNPYSLKIGCYDGDVILDQKVLYDFTTYEEALDFIKDYIETVLTNGVPQEPEVEYNEADVAELKLMHEIMQSMNDEDAYYSWVMTGVPDGATEEDFIDIASNSDDFADCKDLFDKLFKRYSKDGLYKPSAEEINYANQACKRLGLPEIEILEI